MNIGILQFSQMPLSFASSNKKYIENKNFTETEKIPNGADYEFLDVFDKKRKKTINQISNSLANGENIKKDREKLIYSRIPKALKDAENFMKMYPQFSKDDIIQDLVYIVIKYTDCDIKINDGVNRYNVYYAHARDLYFESLLRNQKNQKAIEKELIINEKPHDWAKDYINEEERKKIDLVGIIKSKLTPQEYFVINKRYNIDFNNNLSKPNKKINYEETELRAIKKLKHPKNRKDLKPLLEIYQE